MKNVETLLENNRVCLELQRIIEKLLTIKDEQFSYEAYVKKYDHENNCGTVCCIAGWYPLFFPESGAQWGTNGAFYFRDKKANIINQVDALQEFHNLSYLIVSAVFYGDKIEYVKDDDCEEIVPYLTTKYMKEYSIFDTIERIRKIQTAVLENKLFNNTKCQG